MNTLNSLEKSSEIKPTVQPYPDYQINQIKSEIKPKKLMFWMHSFLSVLWFFIMISNIFSKNYITAIFNVICVISWGFLAIRGHGLIKKQNKEFQSMIDANEKFEMQSKKEKEDMESLDFFKQKATI